MRDDKAEAICMQMKHESQIYRPSKSTKREEQHRLLPKSLLRINLDPATLCQWFFVMET